MIRTIAGFLWYPVAWLLRFYLVVLIEPWFNPLKAPVSLLAAKFMYPVYAIYMSELQGSLNDEKVPTLMKVAWLIIFLTIWLLPDCLRISVLGDERKLADVSSQPATAASAGRRRAARRDGAAIVAAGLSFRHGAQAVCSSARGGTRGSCGPAAGERREPGVAR